MSSQHDFIVELTHDNFELTVQQAPIVIIDFWASWCKPCQAFKPIFEKVAVDNPDIIFAAVDIEQETSLASDFNIRSVPFIVVLRDNIIIYAEAGTLTESAFRDLVEQARKVDVSTIHEKINKG
jgi:thioredoxin 1